MRRLLALALCLLPLAAPAQEDDRGWLTGLLEDNLSDAGREVRIEGFAGALSSRATFDTLTIADGEGVWLTIRQGAIGWNRSALLRGRIEIAELSAQVIEVPRAPVSDDTPSAEAPGFSLPELPVSVSIGRIEAAEVRLGEPLFGAAAVVSLTGRMNLAEGEGTTDLAIQRIDGPRGALTLEGSYANTTRQLVLNLSVEEEADGIAANLIGLPGRPAIALTVAGAGPIDNFRSEIALASDGEPRLSGAVTLLTEAAAPGAPPRRSFRAALGGDVAPLFLPDYRDFFGPDISLVAEGARAPDGTLSLSRLELDAQAVDLTGELLLSPDGLPRRAVLDMQLGLPDGSELLLPLSGERTWVRSGRAALDFDAARGEGWRLSADLAGFRREGVEIGALRLSGSGRIAPSGGAGPRGLLGGTFDFAAEGLALADADLAAAVGPTITGRATVFRQDGDALRIPRFRIAGQDYAAEGTLTVSGLDTGLAVEGRAQAELADLSRFSGLAGRPLGGAGRVEVNGTLGLLSGIHDVTGRIEGQNLTVDQAELDRLMQGASTLTFSIRRDTEGTEIRSLTLAAATLTAEAAGMLRTGASDVTATLDFSDIAALGGGWRGALDAEAHLTEAGGVRRLTVSATGNGLGIGQAEVDRVLAGRSTLALVAQADGERLRLESFRLDNPQVSAEATGSAAGDRREIEITARLADMALLAPGFPGPLTVTGGVVDDGAGYAVDLSGQGPGGTQATMRGRVAADFATTDLAIAGGAQAALVNAFISPRSVEGPVRFDLRLNGRPSLAALSGRVETSGARIVADPALGIALEDAAIAADLSGGNAMLSANARVAGGGRITLSGPVGLSPPHAAELTADLSAVRLRDPELYDTRVSGRVGISGPLTGGGRIAGALMLDETEIRVPSTGLGGVGDIPEIVHVNEPAAVRATRARAGLIGGPDGGGAGGAATRPLLLDLTISAPNRIFVRGRGLDAELGGSLQLLGTTDDIRPVGQFDLVRGRLDILGKRFVLDEGLVQMQGNFVPWLRFSASSVNNGITTTVLIEGAASEPEIRFLSSPELPEEEVLSQLLFGRDLTSLSPLQAAQLASAVATLAGRGGGGIVNRLRQGFGLDDLDVSTDEDGSAAVRAGKYLSDNLYTDVTVSSDGTTEINLNLDVSSSVTVRGTLGSDGGSGIGVFYERDY